MYIYTKLQYTKDDLATYYRYPRSIFDKLKNLSYDKGRMVNFYYWSIDSWKPINVVTSISPREVELSLDDIKKELVLRELQQ